MSEYMVRITVHILLFNLTIDESAIISSWVASSFHELRMLLEAQKSTGISESILR
jgi:hypothetical protein